MKIQDNSLSVPGFMANGIHAGIKNGGEKDLSLIVSSVPAQSVGMFTTNAFKAAPVILDMERIKKGRAQAILVNSGNANAATGDEGYADALVMSKAASDALKVDDDLILVASTGIIGHRLPLSKIVMSMHDLVSGLRSDGIVDANEAIMTTDRFPKSSIRKATIGTKEITLCGIAKGVGMISPHMATMLAFFLTDANIEYSALKRAFRKAVGATFNAISVDGCMSTNDTVMLLANGVADNKRVTKDTKDYSIFRELLQASMFDLAKAIVQDGEGATKVIEVMVSNARSQTDAKKVAFAIANSNLVKTAFYGSDPNWGRIISAIGSVGIPLDERMVSICFDEIPVFTMGKGVTRDNNRLANIMDQSFIKVRVNLESGNKNFKLLTSDLGYEYVKINAHYHT